MKGGLVSMLYGAAAAGELGLLDGRRIVFHFVCDEETGSAAGSGHLREAALIDPEAVAMLTAEPTGGVIWHACRGAITLRVRTSGREAHVGYAHQGVNAFEHMIRIAQPLAALSRELLGKRTGFPVESAPAGGSMLVVGGQAGAGAGFNAVPGSAWFSVDRRFNPEEDLDRELRRRAPGHLPRSRRVHRRDGHAPLRRRLRPVRRAHHVMISSPPIDDLAGMAGLTRQHRHGVRDGRDTRTREPRILRSHSHFSTGAAGGGRAGDGSS